MKVLLLAAGRGTRISRYLAGNPKCTVDIGGQKLIQYTIELFHKKGITDIAMVLGYRAEVIQETLKDYEGIRYFYNPFFDVTNSIASAWFAKDFLSQYDDTLIMNADVYLEETLLDRILECHKSPVMFADGTRKEEADYKYKYENGLLVKYGKELTGSDITGEYIGIGRFSKDFMPEFMEKLDGMIRTQQHSVWWENILYEMVGKRPVYVEEMDGLFWAEVDYVEDYERILRFRGYKGRLLPERGEDLRKDRRPGVSRSRRKEERMKQENGKRAMTAGLRRTMVIFVLDMLCIAGSFFLALWMRFEFRLGAIPQMYLNEYLKIIGPWIVICLVVFQLFRLYNSIWSFVSIDELFRIILAYGVLLAAGLAYVLILKIDMPRSFYFAGFIMSFMSTTALRFSYRFMRQLMAGISTEKSERDRILMIGRRRGRTPADPGDQFQSPAGQPGGVHHRRQPQQAPPVSGRCGDCRRAAGDSRCGEEVPGQ